MMFDEAEVEALRQIVGDWIEEGFTTPPYPDPYYGVFEKLVDDPDKCLYDIRRPS